MNNEDLINNYGSLAKVIINSDMIDNEDDDDENENYEYLSYIEEDDDGSSSDKSNSNNNHQNDQLKKQNDDYNNYENNMCTETELNLNNIIKTEYDHDDNYDDNDYIIYDSGNDDDFDVNDYKQEKDENPNEMIKIEDKYDNFDDHNNDPEYYIMQDNEKIEEPEQLNDVITNNEDKNENDEKCNKNDNIEELYHCNTCNVVFNSVKEHLIEFHQNEDIHIEEKNKNNKKSVKQTQKTEAEQITFLNKQIENNTYEDIIVYSDADIDTDADADANANTNTNPNNDNEYEINKKDDKCIDKNKPIQSIDINNKKNDNSNSNYLEIEQITDNSNSKNRNKIYAVKNKNTITKKKIEKEQYIINTIDIDNVLYNQKKLFRNSVNGVSHMCMQCNKQFKILQDAESHICGKPDINIDLKMKPLTVTVKDQKKGKNTEKKQELQQPSSYNCDECGMPFNSSRSVSLHKRVHKNSNMMTTTTTTNKNVDSVTTSSNKIDTNIICVECNTKFKSLKSLKLHSKMHKSNGTVSSFDRIINSEQTIIGKSGHLSNEYFFCKICDKFYDKVFEDVHYKAHEIETKSVICMICNRKFDNETECSIHMKLHENHPQRRGITKAEIAGIQLPYECSYCGRQFKKPHEKVKHERIHTGEKPHRCDICGKSFRVSYCLTLHIRSHTNARPYVCPTCNKRFKSVAVYTHHLQSHSDKRGYKCPLCPKTFKTSVSLAGHRKSHTKPFSCVECNRPFASLYAVKSHMETHKKNKTNLKHTCIICGAIYAKIFALRDHIKNQHNDVTETNDLDIININNDEIILTNTNNDIDDDIIEYNDNDDDIIMNDDTISITEITDPASIIIGGSHHQTLVNSKSDEIVDLRNFYTEEIVTEWLE